MLKSPLIMVMTSAARKVARALLRDLGEIDRLQVSPRAPLAFAATARERTERDLTRLLLQAHPSWSLHTGQEENRNGNSGNDGHGWLVDPVCGSYNLLHGFPHFCISIAATRDGLPVAGVIFDPVRDELFHAEENGGAYMNGQRLRVSARERLAEALVGLSGPGLAAAPALIPRVAGIRCGGCPALDLAYVAAGRLDACCLVRVTTCEIAAGGVILRAAGGRLSSAGEEKNWLAPGTLLAGNRNIFPKFSAMAGKTQPPETRK